MKAKYIYSPDYDFNVFGFDKLHKFDAKKYSKAWLCFLDRVGNQVIWSEPRKISENGDLLCVHDRSYLDALTQSKVIAKVIEVFFARYVPQRYLNERIIKPIRLGCEGTWDATEAVLRTEYDMVMNLSGGYHHAFKTHGEGFCFFADAALAIIRARQYELLDAKNDHILMIDLDAHRGNGFHSYFESDEHVHILDFYNFQVYPGLFEHEDERDQDTYIQPMLAGIEGDEYINRLKRELPKFLKSHTSPKLAFYNAGTDIVNGDPLGAMNVSVECVKERDRFVLESLKELGVPTVIMTSGGYTEESHKLIASLAETLYKLQ